MRVDDPGTLAIGVRSIDAAARAAAALEAEVSFGDARSEEWYDEASDALELLHRRFPGLHQRDAYRQAPTLSPSVRRSLRAPARAGGRSGHFLALLTTVCGLVAVVLIWLWRQHSRGILLTASVGVVLVSGHARALAAVLLGMGLVHAASHGWRPPSSGRRARLGVRR